MKNSLIVISIVIMSIKLNGCAYFINSKKPSERRIEAIIAETYNRYENREVVFERLTMDFPEYHEETVNIDFNAQSENNKLAEDGSELKTLFDGYGNKIETRTFFRDPLIKMIVVTTLRDGYKKCFVYGQNGEVKLIPEMYLTKIFQMPADEIAKAVEIIPVPKENNIQMVADSSTQILENNPKNRQEVQNEPQIKKENKSGEIRGKYD